MAAGFHVHDMDDSTSVKKYPVPEQKIAGLVY
jgi:hypothetical protein